MEQKCMAYNDKCKIIACSKKLSFVVQGKLHVPACLISTCFSSFDTSIYKNMFILWVFIARKLFNQKFLV